MRQKDKKRVKEKTVVSWKCFKKGEISCVAESSHIQEACTFQRSVIIWATILFVFLTVTR